MLIGRLVEAWLFIKSKIQFLKANHNLPAEVSENVKVVYKVKDTIFES